MVESFVSVTEGDVVSFCVELSGILPFEGLEVDVVVAIEGQGLDSITGITCMIVLIIHMMDLHACRAGSGLFEGGANQS